MRYLFCALTLAMLGSSAALAQIQLTAPPETIYSDAQREIDLDRSRRVVETMLAPSFSIDNQYARWKRPICPHVYGLTPVSGFVIEHRIKEIAAQVGAPVDRNDPCVPNIGIIVTADPQRSFDSLSRRAPWLLSSGGKRDKVEYPVEAWYAGLLRDYNGKASLDQSWEDAGLDGPPYVPAQLSRLSTGQTAEMGAATVLVNTNAVMGLSLGSLADYIALQTLAQAPMKGRCQDIPSIANLMLPNCNAADRMDHISDIDLALLTGLYSAPERPELLQRQRIVGAMKRALDAQAH